MIINLVNEQINKYTLSNGLEVYLHTNDNYTKCYANYMVKYGSNILNFTKGEENFELPRGIAHFLEHVMFQTEDKKDYFDLYSEYGTSSNAYTSYQQTSYIFTSTNNLKKNLEILIKQVQTLTIDEESVKKEKSIIKEELEMYMQNPNYKFRKRMYEYICNSNYQYDIIGDDKSIASIDLKSLKEAYNMFYAPSNSILFISGSFDEKDIIDYLEAIQINLNNKQDVILMDNIENNNMIEIKEQYVDSMVNSPMKMLAYKYNSFDQKKDEIEMDIVLEILEMYMCSYLNDEYIENMESGKINFSLSINSHFHTDLILIYLKISDNIDFDIHEFYLKTLNKITKEDFVALKNKKIAEEIKVFNDPEDVVESSISILSREIDINSYYDILSSIDSNDFVEKLEYMKHKYSKLELIVTKD